MEDSRPVAWQVRKGGSILRRRSLLFSAAGVLAQAQDRRAVILERARILAGFAGQQVGEATPEVLENASKIVRGTVFFYGRTEVKVGLKDIDWSGAHIRHQEWPAQLNRFFHLGPLASAYRATRDEGFARAARAYIEDWIRGDPYLHATTLRAGDNTLNMSIRLGSSMHAGWAGVLPVFLDSPAFDDAFVNQILASIARQADFLSRHLSAVGNWRISQLDALVFTALRFPFLANAQRLRDAGIAGMRAALATQLLPDGVHNERTPGYADWMTSVAANYYRLPKLFSEADARVDGTRLLAALDYGAQSELFGVNDATAPHADPKELRGLRRRAETIAQLRLKAPKEPPLAQVFSKAGQVFLRSAWEPGADYIAFDASSWGGGHGHLSRLSFAFRSGGRMLIADPGILNYEMSDPLAPYGKSTPAHSTLNIGGLNQSAADAQLLRTEFTPGIALIQARYQGGYWQGEYTWSFGKGRGAGTYGSHERILLWVNGEYILVLDSMESDAGADIRNCWQLGPVERWSYDPQTLAWWSENRDTNLLLKLVAAPPNAGMQVFEGRKDPPRGWVGLHGNDAVAAPLVEFRYAGAKTPSVSVVLAAAYKGTNRPGVRAEVAPACGPIRRLEIRLPDGSTDRFAWSPGLALPIDDADPFTTDGTLVWVRNDPAGKPTKWFSLDGRYLMDRDRALISL